MKMNNVELIGRLTTDPELRYTQDEKAYVRQTIAVNRGISKEDKEAGKQSADFISCIFWNQTAENLAKYMKKGSQIAVAGKLRTGKYEAQDGTTRYTTDVRVYQLTF
ncbi:MAG: single-stranded DNA-binding protein, partial [Mycoplasmatota bacterium]|nr:single-stranded DNA-binding protein [Mycoplasmatota bacterium]